MMKKTMRKIRRLLAAPFVFLSLFLPSTAQAQIISTLIAVAIIGTVLFVAIMASAGFAMIAGGIMDWVTGPNFISLSYTNPCPAPNFAPPPEYCNPIVGIGLNITQNFVNLLLVIFLVAIALSIALKIGEYGSGKTFAKLILVALLVNFAPVFVGLIVDAANIVTNFFLQGIGETGGSIASISWNSSLGVAKVIFSLTGFSDRVGLLIQGIAQLILNIGLFLAFSLFAGLFMVRYVMLWVLTILSPLAFVAWVLPATKRLFDMWWRQLIQWAVIGIPIAFFLYLGMNSFGLLQSAFESKLTVPGIEDTTIGFFNSAFPFFVLLIFLVLGFAVALQTGAMGAAAAIRVMKKSGGWVGAKAGKGFHKWAEQRYGWRERVGRVLTGRELTGKFGEQFGKFKFRGKEFSIPGMSGLAGKNIPLWSRIAGKGKRYERARGLQEIRGLRTFIPEAVKEYPYVRKAAEEAKKKLAYLPSSEIVRQMEANELKGPERVAALNELVERDDTSDFFDHWGKKIYGADQWDARRKDAEKNGEGLDYQMKMLLEEAPKLSGKQGDLGKKFLEETKRDFNTALRAGLHKGVLRGSGRMGAMAAGTKIPGGFEELTPGVQWKEAMKLALKQIRPENVGHFEKEEFMTDRVVKGLMEYGDRHWNRAMEVKGAAEETIKTVVRILKDYNVDVSGKKDDERTLKAIWTKFENEYKKSEKNPGAFFSWSESTGRRSGVTKEEIIKRIRDIKKSGGAPGAGSAPGSTPPGTGPTSPGGAAPPRGRPGVGGKPATPGAASGRRPRGKPGVGGP